MTRVIICGAGSAGCVLAARLSQDENVSVLLLEAGPDYPTMEELPDDVRSAWVFGVTEHDWGYVSADHVAGSDHHPTFATPDPAVIHAYRGKVIGGSSSTNASNALRPPRRDFDRWVALGNDQWSWNATLPVFQAMEDDHSRGARHGVGGPIPIRRFTGKQLRPVFADFVEACGAVGYDVVDDLNGTDTGGAGPLPLNQVASVRQSSALCYLAGARSRPNLEIRASTMIDRVELVDGRARAVVLDTGERIDGDLIILSAGALSSPGILMRSGVGPSDLLERLGIKPVLQAEAVGQNLRDHAMVYMTWSLGASVGDPAPPLQAVLIFSSLGPGTDGEVDLHLVPFTPDANTLVAGLGLVRPYSVGRFEITSADPNEPPRILFNVLDHPEDLQRMVRGVRLARELIDVNPIASYIETELWPGADVSSDAELVQAILGAKNTYAHATGTCSMGPAGAPWAVVDQTGRVHGLDGLYVVDASIMPTIPSVPTNLTTIMIAERCAGELRTQVSRTVSAGSFA